MRIPSYDDLAPSIPDVAPRDVLASAAALLRPAGPVAGRAAPVAAATRDLFAALHGGPTDDRLMAIARDFSPRIERWPGASVVLDVSGLQRLLGDPAAIAAHLAQAGAPRVAVATSQIAAVLLARARDGITVATGDPETALRDLPMSVLQHLLADLEAAGGMPQHRRPTRGSDAAHGGLAFDVLRRWGLSTIGEFAALPAPDLSARLGPGGVAVQRLARGLDRRPLVPDPGVPRFQGSFELEWPIDTLEPLAFVFARILDPLAAALERADRGAVAIHLTLRLTDRTSQARTIQLPAAMRDSRVLRTLLLLGLESHPLSAAVDVVSIELDPAPARIVQYSLLEQAVPSPETQATLMARLGALVGEARCGSPVLLDTHRPDGFVLGPLDWGDTSRSSTPSLQFPTPKTIGSQQLGERSGDRAGCGEFYPACSKSSLWESFMTSRSTRRTKSGQRLRLRAQLDAFSEQWGVGNWKLTPTSPAPVLRRFRPPVAIRVATEEGRPVRVAIDRQRMPGGNVRQAAGPWRRSGGWWESDGWNRDEWDVALGDGSACRLFRDRDSGQWFMEGVVD